MDEIVEIDSSMECNFNQLIFIYTIKSSFWKNFIKSLRLEGVTKNF